MQDIQTFQEVLEPRPVPLPGPVREYLPGSRLLWLEFTTSTENHVPLCMHAGPPCARSQGARVGTCCSSFPARVPPPFVDAQADHVQVGSWRTPIWVCVYIHTHPPLLKGK